jgi:hypothetical protein
MNNDSEKLAWFKQEMALLMHAYPKWGKGGETTQAYWRILEGFEQIDLENVFASISKRVSEFPPSAFDLREEARRSRDMRRIEARQQAAKDQNPEGYQDVNPAPTNITAQIKYIGEAKGRGERLARQFECESVRLGIKPWETIPVELAKKRLRALSGLMDDIGKWPRGAA